MSTLSRILRVPCRALRTERLNNLTLSVVLTQAELPVMRRVVGTFPFSASDFMITPADAGHAGEESQLRVESPFIV